MTAFLDVHLKEISQIVKRWTGVTESTLLLDRSRFGIALRDNDASQCIAKLARHFLISRRTVVVAESNPGIGRRRLQEDSPAIIRHLYIIEVRPSLAANVNARAQPDILLLK